VVPQSAAAAVCFINTPSLVLAKVFLSLPLAFPVKLSKAFSCANDLVLLFVLVFRTQSNSKTLSFELEKVN